MSTSAPTPPRADTPTDFREDLTADTPPDVNKDTPPDSSKDTTNTDRHKETPPPTDHNPTTDTQAIILVTPLPHPTDPLISLQRLQIPTHHLTTLIPPTDWHTSAITTHLGLPLKLARYPLLSPAANKIPNPCMIGFSMCCEGDEFGKVAWTKVLGAVAVARVDGADVGVEEVADVVRYVNFWGRG
ncbi:hypothetical protein Tdes44962_MAKER00646 [Teratosphaeria destructans]|uniref:Uncharacterized protein n=1 Tax=Teratosphaeria destructans TaxID=418781 RepID=A0A9W7SNM6_9PEZI|nr:hypothetical protein Tdes44962_MAKER00646 [Teratosphaeria destructans]